MKINLVKWSNKEIHRLHQICESGWDWEFPGYGWVANKMNDEFGNNRSPASCRYWDKKIHDPKFSGKLTEIIHLSLESE